MKYLIGAGNAEQAAHVARAMGWSPDQWRNLYDLRQLLGHAGPDVTVVWYGGWHQRTDLPLQEIVEMARARRIPQYTIGEMR